MESDIEELLDALEIATSIYDNPIARRRLQIDPNTHEPTKEVREVLAKMKAKYRSNAKH